MGQPQPNHKKSICKSIFFFFIWEVFQLESRIYWFLIQMFAFTENYALALK